MRRQATHERLRRDRECRLRSIGIADRQDRTTHERESDLLTRFEQKSRARADDQRLPRTCATRLGATTSAGDGTPLIRDAFGHIIHQNTSDLHKILHLPD
jgi:hypothetical protein